MNSNNMVLDMSKVFESAPDDRPSIQLANGKYLGFVEAPQDKKPVNIAYGALALAVIALIFAAIAAMTAGGISEDKAESIVTSALAAHKVKAEDVEGLQAKFDASSTRLGEAVKEEVGKQIAGQKVLASALSSASASSEICEAVKKCPKPTVVRRAPRKATPAPVAPQRQIVEVVVRQQPPVATASASAAASASASAVATVNGPCGLRHNGVVYKEWGPRSGSSCERDRAIMVAKFQNECLAKNLGSLEADLACGRSLPLAWQQ